MDYRSICTKLQPVLFQSCATLVNSDGSLTSEGTHAMHCIRNGILLGGGAALFGLPLCVILKGLSMLAAPTGCDGIVNMKNVAITSRGIRKSNEIRERDKKLYRGTLERLGWV
jgi:hypothetical protein